MAEDRGFDIVVHEDEVFEAMNKLQRIVERQGRHSDTERNHFEADQILIDLLQSSSSGGMLADLYNKIDKWYA